MVSVRTRIGGAHTERILLPLELRIVSYRVVHLLHTGRQVIGL
uniref:Uncharacterized protein n=1 Tax=Anopheles albimanus TaxID=7167 RepID=A0A182FCB5_ANOAL